MHLAPGPELPGLGRHNGRVQTTNLTGRTLVATPSITDGIFHRAVVLLLHDGADGAQGVVLNHPMTAPVGAVLDGWGEHVSHPGVLFQGGPVGTDSALGIIDGGRDAGGVIAEGIRPLFRRIGVVDLDAEPEPIAERARGLRVFAGYSGWGRGQLAGEIRRGDWFVVDSDDTDISTGDPQTLWSRVLARQSGLLALMGRFPADPELN